MPQVSVIIPNYNHAVYLQQRIDSILNQTYTDFEVIILDDCSTDNSRQIIEQYSNNRKISHIFFNETNSGNVFKQWDKGIQLAKGKYIWIAESDDWCELNLLETLVEGLEKNEDCVLAYCQSFCVTNDGVIQFQSLHTRLSERMDGKKFIKEYLLPKNPLFNAGMALWKKDVYKKISKEYISYKLIGDYYFWIEVASCGNVFISGKLLNYFRTHKNNISTNSVKNGLSYKEQLPLLKHLLNSKLINENDYLQLLKKHYYIFYITAIKKMFADYSKEPFKLEFYIFQKNVQFFFKKLLHV